MRAPVLPAEPAKGLPADPSAEPEPGSFSIAEVSARSGLSPDTLRYYERIALIDPPARNSAGRRAYVHEDLVWLRFLICMRDTGLPLRALREYAALRKLSTEASAARRKQILIEYRRDIRNRMVELDTCLATLDYKIGNYEQLERKLAAMSGAQPAGL